MYNEEQYIYETFKENFIQNKKGNIVLYGTGIHTAKLLEKLRKGLVKGLMDVKRTGETLWGYQVLAYEDVRKISNVCIVIIARDAVLNTVYRRIEGFCKEYSIPVYDIHGRALTLRQTRTEVQECFLLKSKELLEKIEQAEYVTFDIFDTLLTRKILSPQEVFRYIDTLNPISGLIFSEERKKAEAYIQYVKNPTIYDIYHCLQKFTGISKQEQERLLTLEIETENNMLCRRESMCKILDYIRKQGKKVYLISDMYFTGDIIEMILKSHQITGYDGLYVSCDYLVGKQEGLFQIVKADLCLDESARILHIGDNTFADIFAASESGYDTYQIFSPREMYERSMYSMVIPEPQSIEEELALGKFVSLAYNNPFGKYKENGKLILESAEQVAELFIAPVIWKYMLFLLQKIFEKQIDFVIFPSRDGYLLQKLYDIMKDTEQKFYPESVYLYTSRRAALIASAYTEKDINDILSINDTRELKDMIKARFGINVEVEWKEDERYTSQNMLEYLLKICREEREIYKKYIVSSGILEHHLPGIIDFIAVGTVQSALEKITDKKMQGIYFWKRRSSEERYEKLCVDSLYQPAGDFDMSANIYRYYYLLENILSSSEPSFRSLSQEGKPCFYKEEREKKDIEILGKIHNSIENYVRDIGSIMPEADGLTDSISIYDAILGLLSKEYSEFDEETIFHMKNVDEFMGRVVTNMNR